MKKCIAGLLALVCLMGGMLAQTAGAEKQLNVVTTIFPIFDWVRQIDGDTENIDLTMLLDDGIDLHSFQPTAADIMKIATCDLFIYVGGESDEWVEDALKMSVNPDMRVINLLETLGDAVKEEELVEGMEAEDEEGEEEEEAEYDEHVWLSLRNAKALCAAIESTLAELDPDNAETYQANLAAYARELDDLDAEYAATVDQAARKTLLFGDRFPFRYLADDYGLDYFAAFAGCSAETEASFETIVFLSGKVDELELPAVMTIDGAEHRIAETIVQNTQAKNQRILTLDSLQAVTAEGVKNGARYLDIMQANLEVLRQALCE